MLRLVPLEKGKMVALRLPNYSCYGGVSELKTLCIVWGGSGVASPVCVWDLGDAVLWVGVYKYD